MMALEWRDRAALGGALLVAAACVRLGVWQLDRLRQRRERNAQVLARLSQPPLPVTGALSADSARDRRLSARGVYDYAHERLWYGQSYEGVPGVDLVTPLRLPDGV
ncbi:MAG: SURF1 family protein, partial [Gemmatimonadetes bacterium]